MYNMHVLYSCYIRIYYIICTFYVYRRVSSVAVIYVLYVRLVNWTTRQRLHRLDRKNPDVSIGRSCFIGLRTETREIGPSLLNYFSPSISFLCFFFFFLDQPDQIVMMVDYNYSVQENFSR